MKIRIPLLTLILGITTNSFAQDIKIFNDKFQDGFAEYEYYLNDNYDVVYNGYFKFNGEKYDVKGSYKNNLPEGEWIVTADKREYSNWQSKIQTNTLVKGKYSNGLLQGTWTYENAFSLIDFRTGKFKTGEETDKDVAKASFLNNHFVGDINYSRNFQKINISGSFDNNGYIAGTWTYTKAYEEDIVKYKNGVAYWRLVRNLPTNEKILFIDISEFVNNFWDNYDSINNISIVNDKIYYAEKKEIDNSERIKENVINLTNIDIVTNRRVYDNPAIAIWQDISVDIYQSHSATNPLYYGIRDSRSPIAYEILIKECSYSTSNNKYISNSTCTQMLKEIKHKKELELKNTETFLEAKGLQNKLKQTVIKVEEESKNVKTELENIKVEYAQNYQSSLSYLSNKFSSIINEYSYPEKYNGWTNNDNKNYNNLKRIENTVDNFLQFHNTIMVALRDNDKKTLKKLKGDGDISQIISLVMNK